MTKCKITQIDSIDLNKYTPLFKGKELLKQIFLEHSQTLKAFEIELNVTKEKVSGVQPCTGLDGRCGSTDFYRTGTCHVCISCGSSQGCS